MAEVGCGVGNFALPLLAENSNLTHLYACDFSEKAVEILKSDERHTPDRCTAFVADLTQAEHMKPIPAGSLDVVTTIFVMSAIPPEKFGAAIQNLATSLRPGGLWLFRDYAINDAAQSRFKEDRKISDTLFVRQDGTLSYFFEKGNGELRYIGSYILDELTALAAQGGFELVECDYINSKTSNVKKEIDVDRTFLQAKFRLK